MRRSTAGLIPKTNADELNGHLKDIASAVDDGRCSDADSAFRALVTALRTLPASVDQRITLRFVTGTRRLERRIPIDCVAAVPGTTTATATTDRHHRHDRHDRHDADDRHARDGDDADRRHQPNDHDP
jgi:hypothetical protein